MQITNTTFSDERWDVQGQNSPFPARRAVTLTVTESFAGSGKLSFSVITSDDDDLVDHRTLWALHRSGSGSAELPPFSAEELPEGRTFVLPLVPHAVGRLFAVKYDVDGEAFSAGAITAEMEQGVGVTSGPGVFKQSAGAAMAPNF